ncbi:hypothetical protein GCM10009798_11310 [Nocardioides panacihumi]|uniref:Sporulation stage II protein D amidase enhancer LytB N-terminal domain-containing protein n=2 Tax=Nocardioides panacihumi TaxID=400774 RepID=A0ABN2QKL3_9ACTN
MTRPGRFPLLSGRGPSTVSVMPFVRQALRALALGAGLTVAVATPSYADSTVNVPAGATSVTVYGEGSGHGHGLSQYGANAAAKRGLSTSQILGHYYPGTRAGAAGGQVRVLLSTRPALIVGTRSGLTANVVGSPRRWRLTHLRSRAARTATRWRATAVSPTRSRLSYRKGGHWRTYAVATGQLQFNARGLPIRLYAGHDSGTFRGVLRAASPSATSADRDIVNVVPLEAYVKGVVPNEMPALWAPAAVRAQAIAARTYAVHERTTVHRGYFDVFKDTRSQVYRGYGSEQRASTRAVDATRRQIRTYAGRPAFTQFTASNGGYMLANGAPYLVSGRDGYDPVNAWSKTIPMSAFQARFGSTYPLRSITVRTYPGAGGWVETVTLTGTNGKTNSIGGVAFRAWAGLKSGSFRFTR